MNKIFLIGNLVKEPASNESANGTLFTRFTVAVNRQEGGEQVADFFDCVAFRILGENVLRYCHKGSKVAVVGSLKVETYTDSEGAKRQRLSIICSDVEFLTPRNDGGEASEKKTTRQVKLQDVEDDEKIPF